MKEKIFQLLKLYQVDFKSGIGDFCDFVVYNSFDKIIINCKTYYGKSLTPYYSLNIKNVFDNTDKYEYNCFSYDLNKCVSFFEKIMVNLGVFPENDL